MVSSKINTKSQRQINKRKTQKRRNQQKQRNKKNQRNGALKRKRRNHTRKPNNKRRKTMKGGSWPLSGSGILPSMWTYQVDNTLTPLTDRTVDNTLTNPNYSSQFPLASNDPNLVTGPLLSIE